MSLYCSQGLPKGRLMMYDPTTQETIVLAKVRKSADARYACACALLQFHYGSLACSSSKAQAPDSAVCLFHGLLVWARIAPAAASKGNCA